MPKFNLFQNYLHFYVEFFDLEGRLVSKSQTPCHSEPVSES